MKVKFLRVLGRHASTPQVIANAGGQLVQWQPRKGWRCDCDPPGDAKCSHIVAVIELLDERVLRRTPPELTPNFQPQRIR